MNSSLCGADCAACLYREACKGCAETNGCPFGPACFVAQRILSGGMEAYQAFKHELLAEINALGIPGMGRVEELYPLVGRFVNLEYPLPGGAARFLCDDEMYLGAQVEGQSSGDRKTCFGVIARESFLLVCEYGENGADPELVLYKRREKA